MRNALNLIGAAALLSLALGAPPLAAQSVVERGEYLARA